MYKNLRQNYYKNYLPINTIPVKTGPVCELITGPTGLTIMFVIPNLSSKRFSILKHRLESRVW